VIGPQESSLLLGSRSPNTAGQLWLSLRPARYSPDPGRPVIRFNGSPELRLLPALPSNYLDATLNLQVNLDFPPFSWIFKPEPEGLKLQSLPGALFAGERNRFPYKDQMSETGKKPDPGGKQQR
jgi:hypothetical protein